MRRPAALVAALAALVSLPAVRGGFVIDDAYLVVQNQALRSLANVPRFFVSAWGGGIGGAGHAGVNAAYFRPLTSTLQALEYAVFGLAPFGWHLVSILLHAAAAGLVALLALRMVRDPVAALVAGALFAVHPVHTEAVAAISYQTTLLSAVLALGALVLVGRMLDLGGTHARAALAALLALAACAAKEEAVVVPLLAAAWIVVVRPPGWRRALVAGAGGMALAAAVFVALRSAIVAPSSITFFGDSPRTVVVLTMTRVAWLYAGLLVAPLHLCPFYDWFIVPPETSLSAAVALGLLCIVAWFALVALAVRRLPAAAVGLLWVPLSLLPVLHLVPILNVAAERFLYLGSAGFCIAVAAGFAALQTRIHTRRVAGAALVVAMVAAVLVLGARTFARWPDWRDDVALNQSTAAQFPGTPTPLLNLAVHARTSGRTHEAIGLLRQAQRRAPGFPVPARLLRDLGASSAEP